MDVANYTKSYRKEGKLVIEIPESRILEAVSGLLYGGAEVKDPQRLLDHLTSHLTSRLHTASGRQESVLNVLIGETLAEAAHAGAGLEWRNPTRHELIHE